MIKHVFVFQGDHKTTSVDNQSNFTALKIHRNTQTDIISLNKCDSCFSAMLCMKNILKTFETSALGTDVHLRPQIYDITQFGSMMQVAQSVNNSLHRLSEKLTAKDEELDLHKTRNATFRDDIEKSKKKLDMLDQELKIYKKRYETSTKYLVYANW